MLYTFLSPLGKGNVYIQSNAKSSSSGSSSFTWWNSSPLKSSEGNYPVGVIITVTSVDCKDLETCLKCQMNPLQHTLCRTELEKPKGEWDLLQIKTLSLGIPALCVEGNGAQHMHPPAEIEDLLRHPDADRSSLTLETGYFLTICARLKLHLLHACHVKDNVWAKLVESMLSRTLKPKTSKGGTIARRRVLSGILKRGRRGPISACSVGSCRV